MFADFLRRLTAPDPEPLPETDCRLALAAVMVRIARADDDYASVEIAQIDAVLQQRYGLDPTAATALRSEAEALEAEAPDTVRFTRAIKDAVPYDERSAVLEAMWQVALADGERDFEEDSLMRVVSSLLGITDQDSARARQRAKAGLA